MDVAIISAIGSIVLGLGGIIYKMWHDHTALAQHHSVLAQRVIEVVQANAAASTELKGAVAALAKTNEQQCAAVDRWSKTLMALSPVKTKRKK